MNEIIVTDAKSQALQTLSMYISDGDTIHWVCRGIAPSGMSARYSFHYVSRAGQGEVIDVTGRFATALERKLDKNGYIRVNGCGFNRPLSVIDDVALQLGISLRERSI